jgi:predicted NBD/HSP70 family sugar kinase
MPVNSTRALNRSHVLNALADGEAGMRTKLADRVGLSAMAVTRIVRELIEAGLVEEADAKVRPEPGRRPVELAINPTGAYVLGFELHAYQVSVVVMDLARQVVRRRSIELTAPTDGPQSLAEMAATAKREIRASGIVAERLVGAGLTAIGVVDRERGTLVDPSYLGWQPIEAAALLRDCLDVPVVVDRTANALLAAEARHSTKWLQNALLVNVAILLSAALLVEGNLARGGNALAGQMGHIETTASARICLCGRRGCLNVTASGWAALADLDELDDPILSTAALRTYAAPLTDLLHREAGGDRAACAALERAGRNLGRAIRPLRTVLDPTHILLSGPVGRTASYLNGVQDGIGEDGADAVQSRERLIDEAAALMAFDAFIRTPSMDFARLSNASRRSGPNQ